MTTPKVSIIVPVYNAERYLSECLDAIFGPIDFKLLMLKQLESRFTDHDIVFYV